MPQLQNVSVEAAPTNQPWLPAPERGAKLKANGASLTHSYETDTRALAEADWVYLQVGWIAYQVHPMGWDALDVYGAFDGRDMQRWTWEGPTSLRAGEVGNCSIACELAYSTTSSPGSDWRAFRPGRYKLRSFKVRLVVTRPSTSYDFRILRLATRATRVAVPRREVFAERFFDHG